MRLAAPVETVVWRGGGGRTQRVSLPAPRVALRLPQCTRARHARVEPRPPRLPSQPIRAHLFRPGRAGPPHREHVGPVRQERPDGTERSMIRQIMR